MESRFRILLLSHLLLAAGGCAALVAAPAMAADDNTQQPEQVIKPQLERREIKEPKIGAEDFEMGVFAGLLSVEDFGVNPVVGARLAYHVTEGIFVETAYGQANTKKTSYETLSGSATLLTDDQRKLRYYNVSFGYNVLPGEAFIGKNHAFNNSLYLIGGIGSTHFAGENRFTVNYGFGYRLLATDWLAVRLDVRDHVFQTDLLGEKKTTHNIETHAGITFYF